jgi:hypothetical protein
MLILKPGCSQKEKKTIKAILDNCVDLYGDFYVTRENIRIALRDNSDILFNYLKKGSQFVYDETNENGIALILREKGFRTYIKILTKDTYLANKFLKMISWHVKENLYVKLKKNNPLIKTFQYNNFQFKGDRGNEILLERIYVPRPEYKVYKGDDNE